MADLDKVIWLGRVAGLRRRSRMARDALSIGAMASHADAFAGLAAIDPDLGEIMRRFGSVQVRASGTVGGNIANGSPIGDLAPALIALGARARTAQRRARRATIAAGTISSSPIASRTGSPANSCGAIIVPKLKADEVFRAYKVTKRFDEDISAVHGRVPVHARRATHRGGARRLRRHGGHAEARAGSGGGACRHLPRRAGSVGEALVGARRGTTSLSTIIARRPPTARTVARNLLFKALERNRIGETRATRIIGHRDALQAAE